MYSVKILLDTPAIPEIKPLLLQPDTVLLSQVGQYTASHIGYKKLNLKGNQLSEVNITSKKKVYSSNPAGPGSAEKTLGTDVLKRYDSLRMALESNTTFILFDRNNQPYIDEKYAKRFRTIKQFVTILDGMQVHNDYLQLVHPNDIESVEIVMRQVNYPDKGLIVINTKKKSTSYNWGNDAVPGVTIARVKGYTAYREFYIPKFKTNETIADNRDVVYWNADIVPNETGKAGIALSNLYKPGKYRIVVEGISANGNIGRVVYLYKSDTNP
ncbi:hypothetical protein IM792_20585 [Mucilaginibacter sp. JRF]|uniref:hypothetical protein n=1 Tax=Mucilaginibacter sp. JRF TaxID=2780088 RepID=UPI00187F1290|nr:hypothetical protein [Mucilaginibacter sp. JRF]MBE9586858.1 hypothetical protein [Mucilaginibacter sp. JRF]